MRPHDLDVPSSFLDLCDVLLGSVVLEDALRDAAHALCQALGAERATVYVVRDDTWELESVALIGNVSRAIRVPIDSRSLAGHCAASGRAFIVPDAYGDLSEIAPELVFDGRWDKLNDFRTRDVLCAPVLHGQRLRGVIQVINSLDGGFGDAEILEARTVARVVAHALEHARLYEELANMKQLEKMKAGFMRVMVHELKSPVAASMTMIDAYRMLSGSAGGGLPPERTHSMIDRVGIRLGNMMTMIKDILDHSRVTSGGAIGEVKVVDVSHEVASAARSWIEQAEAKGIDLRFTVEPDVIPVRVDEQGFRMVVSNLISNGIKYTEHGYVQVSVWCEGPWARFSVRDSGIGIPEDDIPKLFREFFRASNARKKKIEGTGVGLAGVKQIVERFGGHLALTSVLDEGSTFTASLPLHVEKDEAELS
jgi:signal transduction histidine kinase